MKNASSHIGFILFTLLTCLTLFACGGEDANTPDDDTTASSSSGDASSSGMTSSGDASSSSGMTSSGDASSSSGMTSSGDASPPDMTLLDMPDPSALCGDLMQNGEETDVDCGGRDCPGCGEGAQCGRPQDCLSNVCIQGACAPSDGPCSNGTRDGMESDVDCGGPQCPQCRVGEGCGIELDCTTGLCMGGVCALSASGEPTCATYCEELQAACTDLGETNQFVSFDACMTVCEGSPWDVGADTDTSGNTLGCRLNYTRQAAAANDDVARLSLCQQAGHSGGGVCGDWCEVYCDANLAQCTGSNANFTDAVECNAACATYPAISNGTHGHAAPNYLYYDTVQCRITHLMSTLLHSVSVHCPHTSPESAIDACDDASLPNCAHYCDMMLTYCDGGPQGDCLDECRGIYITAAQLGQHSDFAGDTLGCRINQAQWAGDCASAQHDGGSLCQ